MKCLRAILAGISFGAISLSAYSNEDVTCTYNVLSNWGSGSQLTFKITNHSSTPLPEWSMRLSYPSSYTYAHSWTVAASGTNPILFENLPSQALLPGEHNSHHFGYQVNHNGAPFTLPTIDWCGEESQSQEGEIASALIDETGGGLQAPGVADIWFPNEAFSEETEVSLSVTSSQEVSEVFTEMADIFRVSERSPTELRINTGSNRPMLNSTQVELQVPSSLISAMSVDDGIEVLAGFEQGGMVVEGFTIFEILESNFDATTSTVSFELPATAFISNDLTGNEFEAILVLAVTPGENTPPLTTQAKPLLTQLYQLASAQTSSTASAGQCQAASIDCPVAGGCTVTSPFQPARIHPVLGTSRPHMGVDYQAATGTSINAAADGVVERSYNSTSYGNTVVVRHTDGSATLYAHLNARNVSNGDPITAGQQLGTAGSTGLASGPHLHFEYVPNGQIFGSKQRIDPDACIDAMASGSVTVLDSGSAADDAFSVAIDGFVIGQTSIGGLNTLAINNLKPGAHILTLNVVIAPDNVGTYTVKLNDGLTFFGGGILQTGSAPQGASLDWQINVPIP